MNVLIEDKIVLMKELDKLDIVGKVYEVGNITNKSVIIRDVKTKMAVGSIDIDLFDEYFEKYNGHGQWTEWCKFYLDDEVVGIYRTNRKKVQVRSLSGKYRAESSCHKEDKFYLYFGIALAYYRCRIKELKKYEREKEELQKEINRMIESLE